MEILCMNVDERNNLKAMQRTITWSANAKKATAN